jgi:23S rRNA (adenine2503-C2)-methyltransferase
MWQNLGAMTKTLMFGFTLSELETLVQDLGAPKYTAKQLADWIYRKHAPSFEVMTNLSKSLRTELEQHFSLHKTPPITPQHSADGTIKYLYPFDGGSVEAAYIPDQDRATLCLSTQVGCKMGCSFCMTGRQGFYGNLTPHQILTQLECLPERENITNLVFMGMGEPLDNLENVLNSLTVLTSDWGYHLSHQRITVSTVGLIPQLEVFFQRTQVRFALSVHSPFDEERAQWVPVQKVYPLSQVIQTIKKWETGKKRRLSVEYILFESKNDSPRHAHALAKLLKGLDIRVNLIKFHHIPGSEFQSPPREKLEEFQQILMSEGIQATIRKSRGEDIEAACGLLSSKKVYSG